MSQVRLRYIISVPDPNTHLFHVRLEVARCGSCQHIDLSMPVWTPGSYMVREHPRHVQNLRAYSKAGDPIEAHQLDKATWRVACGGPEGFAVEYEVFSHQLAVRTNHLDDTHGFFNGVALYLWNPEWLTESAEVVFSELPQGWEIYTGLPQSSQGTFVSPDFDVLFDTPFEMGDDHDVHTFESRGVPHRVVVWKAGLANYDPERLIPDIQRACEANADLFDAAYPYDDYTFLIHLKDAGRGGLEHLNSTVLLWSPQGFRELPVGKQLHDDGSIADSRHLNFMRLVSHEHYHVWNVKRIRPERLGPFAYDRENYTRDLWTVEGVTSYYENVGLLRAGLIRREKFLEIYADAAKSLRAVPGRKLHSLEASSLNAWVKLYRPDENTQNSSVSYYLKGELVCFLLDAHIRAKSDGAKSLDDVLRALWAHFQETGQGYEEGSYGTWVERVTGVNVEGFLDDYVRGTRDLDYDTELAPFGLSLSSTATPDEAWFGATTSARSGRLLVTKVPTAGPAAAGGIYAGDELIALDGQRISPQGWSKVLVPHVPGESVRVHLFRRGELLERSVTLGEAPATKCAFVEREGATQAERDALSAWLGAPKEGSE